MSDVIRRHIYAIFGPNRHVYVGETNDIEKRWRAHVAQRNKRQNALQSALRRYRRSRFEVVHIATTCSAQPWDAVVVESIVLDQFVKDGFVPYNRQPDTDMRAMRMSVEYDETHLYWQSLTASFLASSAAR